MRLFLLRVFGTFRKVEGFLFGKLSGKGLGWIPGVSAFGRLRAFLLCRIYDELKPKKVCLMNIQGNHMYVNPDDRGIASMLLMDGVMEPYETILFRRMIKEGMVVVDIGANIGYYSLIAAKLVGKSGVVYAFEPEPTTYELLCRNVEVNNYTNVVPIQRAVSNTNEKVKLWVDKTGIAISSLSKDNVLAFSTGKLSEEPYFAEVEAITLDDFFGDLSDRVAVDFIKVDTQGAEGLILLGAEGTLKKNHHMRITMEFWPDGLRSLGTDPLELLLKLQEYGFKIKLINEREQCLEPIEPIEFCRALAKKSGHQEFNLLLEK